MSQQTLERLSVGMATTLTEGVEKCSSLMEELRHDLGSLVTKYLDRLEDMAFLALAMRNVQTSHLNADEYTPEVLRSRIQGYLNVLAAIKKPIEHDCALFETLIHDALKALEDTPHWDRAFSAYKSNLAKISQK